MSNFLNSWVPILKINTQGKKILISVYINMCRKWTASMLFIELAAKEFPQNQISTSKESYCPSYIKKTTPTFWLTLPSQCGLCVNQSNKTQ